MAYKHFVGFVYDNTNIHLQMSAAGSRAPEPEGLPPRAPPLLRLILQRQGDWSKVQGRQGESVIHGGDLLNAEIMALVKYKML